MKDHESMTLGQVLEIGAARAPDKIAVVDGTKRVTYRELNSMADALSAGLAQIGFKKGDRAAIYMKNSLELVVAFYALQKIGAIAVWINPLYRQDAAGFILENSEAKGVFIFDQWENNHYLDEVLALKNKLPDLETIILAGKGAGQGVHSFYSLVDAGQTMPPQSVDIDPREDLAMLLYTSGTTGQPKGAMISHQAAGNIPGGLTPVPTTYLSAFYR